MTEEQETAIEAVKAIYRLKATLAELSKGNSQNINFKAYFNDLTAIQDDLGAIIED